MFNIFKASKAASMTPQQAFERLGKGEIQLVDVREPGEWAQMRIAGARHAPLSTLAQNAASLPQGKPVVFYCLSGQRSARAVDLCRRLGLPHDTHMSGGISGWRSAGLPVEP